VLHASAVVLTRSLLGVAFDKKFAISHNNLGYVLGDQGKLSEASAEYRKAIELDPKLAAPHAGLGDVLRNQGKTDEAIAEYKKAIELAPDKAVFKFDLESAQQEQREAQGQSGALKPAALKAKKK
jgi:tetratricopeptide (TPR) repeat protein